MSRLECAALLASSMLLATLSGCVTTPPGEVTRGNAAVPASMPPIQVAHANQTDEPPLAPIVLAPRPAGESNAPTILRVRADSASLTNREVPANIDIEAADPRGIPASVEPKSAESPLIAALRCYLNRSPEQAARCLEEMDQADRDLLAALLPLAVRIGDGTLKSADPQDVSTFVADLQALIAP